MADFDLRALVQSVNDGASFANPREFAEKVAENVPSKALRAALAEALAPYCRIYWAEARRPASITAAPRNSARSNKVKAIREAWRKVLAGHFHVGKGAWLPLSVCSYENVCFLAEERYTNAQRSQAAGDMFTALGAAMKKHKVERVDALPESVLAEILTVEDVAA